MKKPTKDELEFQQKMKITQQVMDHNGHIAYQMFTGKRLKAPIRITGISAPLMARPIFVGFIDPELMTIQSANDVDNPDGSKAPQPLAAMSVPVVEAPPVKKRATLRVIK